MGVSLTGMAKSRRVLAIGIAALALFAASTTGNGAAQPVSAATCADVELQPIGSPTLSGCGISRLGPNAAATEAHFATGTNRAGGVTEAQQPGANARLGRAGRSAAPANAAAASSVSALPPRKTIDLTQLPAGLVTPAK